MLWVMFTSTEFGDFDCAMIVGARQADLSVSLTVDQLQKRKIQLKNIFIFY